MNLVINTMDKDDEILQAIKNMKYCQFCGTNKQVTHWIPVGSMCKTCKRNLDNIRKGQIGIPVVKRK